MANDNNIQPVADDSQIVLVYTNLKVYHFLIKKCTTPNRLQRYA